MRKRHATAVAVLHGTVCRVGFHCTDAHPSAAGVKYCHACLRLCSYHCIGFTLPSPTYPLQGLKQCQDSLIMPGT
jgi:hypothetical protein